MEIREDICCACSACKQICPQNAIIMKRDERGFLLPEVLGDKCIDCKLCEKVCIFKERLKNPLQKNVLKVVGIKKKKERHLSQSGGAFAAFAEKVLENNGIVYGVVYDKVARYFRVTELTQLQRVKGSKYVQAEVNDIFLEVENDLKNKKEVLFSGTACHIDGLYSYLKKKNINMEKLITCDLICHGVPSPLLLEEYIKYTESKFGEIKEFNFRKKLRGGVAFAYGKFFDR